MPPEQAPGQVALLELAPQRLAQQLGGFQERVELSLVVRDAARVEPAVPLGELERRRLPELERCGRLNVEVPVQKHSRRSRAVGVSRNVADDEVAFASPDELRLAARPLDEVANPLGRPAHVVGVRGIGADTRDRDELAQLVQPDLVHGARVYVTGPTGGR